jgi:hypothetical protein
MKRHSEHTNQDLKYHRSEHTYFDSSSYTRFKMADGNNGNLPGPSARNNPRVQPVPADQGAAQLAAQILNNTNIMLKHEVIKIPEFFGQKGKDTITAIDFIARVDECQISNNWNHITTFSNFHLYFCGSVDKWLRTIIRRLTPEQKTWTRIRPLFKHKFMIVSDDRLIVDGLAKITHRPEEEPHDFYSRLSELMYVLNENYASYRIKPDRPSQQPQGGYSENALTKYGNDTINSFSY